MRLIFPVLRKMESKIVGPNTVPCTYFGLFVCLSVFYDGKGKIIGSLEYCFFPHHLLK